MSTIEYYNQNAKAYAESTSSLDVSSLYDRFEPYLHRGASIIDLGCGSGRDSKHFSRAGYNVTAIDGSEELCKQAEKLTGLPVRCMLFGDLDYESEFDAVWACSSLLHVPKAEMKDVFQKIARALKPNGTFFATFKYGEKERVDALGRYFSDYTEKDLSELTGFAPDLCLAEFWISQDVSRPDVKWLNIIWRKEERSVQC